MSLERLRELIEIKAARLAIVGMGYVGLPVACAFADAGFEVLGVDIQAERVARVNAGICPIGGREPGLQELLGKVVNAGRLRATDSYGGLKDYNVVFIMVETPVDETHMPNYATLQSALHSLGPVMQPGALVIVESTLAPGTMDNVVRPTLEAASGGRAGVKFYLGHCPERVMPGRLLTNLKRMERVVGGMTPEVAEVMRVLYRHIVTAPLHPTDCLTAELVKTTENAYRDVQIAFANEIALICEAVGGDVWQVRDLVNRSPGRHMLLPGAGVGGHCIPKDPWLLAHGACRRVPVRLIPAARAVNDGMPSHMLGLVERVLQRLGKRLEEASVLILGYAYLEDSDDTRNSPAVVLAQLLRQRGVRVVIHDPYVPGYAGDVYALAEGCDVAVLVTAHSDYRELDWKRLPPLVDGRGVAAHWTARVGVGESYAS